MHLSFGNKRFLSLSQHGRGLAFFLQPPDGMCYTFFFLFPLERIDVLLVFLNQSRSEPPPFFFFFLTAYERDPSFFVSRVNAISSHLFFFEGK